MFTSIQLLKRIFSVRNLMRALFVVIALVTVWAMLCVEERWRGERQWNNYRKEALERGAKLEMKDVIPPDIPDAENYAAIPLIQDLFKVRPEGQSAPKWFVTEKLGELYVSAESKRRNLPMLEAYRDEFVKRGLVPAPASDPAEAVLTALKLVEPELRQFHAAAQRPSAKFPVPWERGFAALLPHLAPMQETCKLYRLAVAAYLAKGDGGAALEHFRDGFRIYTAMRGESALISGLVRISCLRMIEEATVDGDALSKWSDGDLQQIGSLLGSVDLAADFEFAVNSERAVINTVHDEMMSKSDLELARFGNDIGIGPGKTSVSLYPRGWFRLSQVKTNQYFDRKIAVGLKVADDSPKDPLLQPGTSFIAKLPYVLYAAITPAFDELPKKYVNAISFRDQVLIACALERFRLKNSSYPEKLDALLPEFLASIPHDPVDGSPMRYRRENDGGFVLWSIGANRIDDGGKLAPGKSVQQQLDWILQVPGKP
jgi:hypothetical protein